MTAPAPSLKHHDTYLNWSSSEYLGCLYEASLRSAQDHLISLERCAELYISISSLKTNNIFLIKKNKFKEKINFHGLFG